MTETKKDKRSKSRLLSEAELDAVAGGEIATRVTDDAGKAHRIEVKLSGVVLASPIWW